MKELIDRMAAAEAKLAEAEAELAAIDLEPASAALATSANLNDRFKEMKVAFSFQKVDLLDGLVRVVKKFPNPKPFPCEGLSIDLSYYFWAGNRRHSELRYRDEKGKDRKNTHIGKIVETEYFFDLCRHCLSLIEQRIEEIGQESDELAPQVKALKDLFATVAEFEKKCQAVPA